MKVPLIECDPDTTDGASVAQAIDDALSRVGFMAVRNLGLSPRAISGAFAAARGFFDSDPESKARCAYGTASENFGYQGLLEESLDPSSPADLKETFTMRNLQAQDLPAQRWPSEDFRQTMRAFYGEAVSAAQRLQRYLAAALDVDEDFFVQRHNGENTTLRLLHYPPIAVQDVRIRQMGAGAHTDYGMLTLLMQDDVGGLEVQGPDGSWSPVPPREDSIVINSGDLLERWTNGRYRSTPHRVRPRTPGRGRYSIALFVDPDSDTVVQALPGCVAKGEAARYTPITAGAHLQARIEATHRA